MQYINDMSDTGINPSLPPGTTIAVPDYKTLLLDDNSNDTLLRANNHRGCHMLKHIIDEPGPNQRNIRRLDTMADRINLACNVHAGMGYSGGALRHSGSTYLVCRVNTHTTEGAYLKGEQME